MITFSNNIRDTLLMERIVTYLCKKKPHRYDFKLNKSEQLNNIIIPFFQKYSKCSRKNFYFQSFVEAASIIKSKPSRQWTAELFNKIKNILVLYLINSFI